MSQRLRAIYRDGAFVPQTPCDLPEDAEVELIVQGPHLLPPKVKDVAARAEILKQIVERMRQNPIPAGAPRFTRDELHERR